MQDIHHLGLCVPDLDKSCSFFDLLARLDTNSKGRTALSDVRIKRQHHIVIQVYSIVELLRPQRKLEEAASVKMEFGPEYIRDGRSQHMICIEPSGICIELIWIPDEQHTSQ